MQKNRKFPARIPRIRYVWIKSNPVFPRPFKVTAKLTSRCHGGRIWTAAKRLAWTQQPNLYLEPKWLRYPKVWSERSDQSIRSAPKTTPVGFEPTRGDPIGLAGRRLSRSAKVSLEFYVLQLVTPWLCLGAQETSGFLEIFPIPKYFSDFERLAKKYNHEKFQIFLSTQHSKFLSFTLVWTLN